MVVKVVAVSILVAIVMVIVIFSLLLSPSYYRSVSADTITNEPPTVYDSNGKRIKHVISGQQVTFSKFLFNGKDAPQPFFFVFEIRDEREFTHYLAWQNSTLPAKSQVNVGASWTTENPGKYKIRTLLQTQFGDLPPDVGHVFYESELIVLESVSDMDAIPDHSSLASQKPVIGIITDEPIGPRDIVKINDIQIKEKRTRDPSFDLMVEPKPRENGIGVIFKIVNVGDQDKAADIDGWRVDPATSNTFAEKSVGAEENPAIKTGIIPVNESQVIMEVDYEAKDYSGGWFEAFPGPHTLLLMGFNMEDWARFDQLEEDGVGEYEREDRARFLLKVDVIIGFNEELLRASESKVILANNTIIAIEGNATKSTLFEITVDEPKTIIFNITNNYNYPVSAKLDDPGIWVWHAETAKYEILGGGEIDYFDDSCYDILMPGESVEVGRVTLKKDAFPLAAPLSTGRGISAQLEGGSSNIAKEGMYVALISGGTFSCAAEDGVRVPGILYTGAIAFEVR
jgi:hypothetical protein